MVIHQPGPRTTCRRCRLDWALAALLALAGLAVIIATTAYPS